MRVFYGTPAEFREVAHLFNDSTVPQLPLAADMTGRRQQVQQSQGDLADMVYQAIIAAPVTPSQRRVLDALTTAAPGSITRGDLQAAVPDVRNIGGVIGGIGLRLVNRGWPSRHESGVRPSRRIIIRERNATGEVTYRASEALVAAWQLFNGGAA